MRVREDHVAHRLVIFDVAGAAAEMAIERLMIVFSRSARGTGFFARRSRGRGAPRCP
jgi:hypothetical protein